MMEESNRVALIVRAGNEPGNQLARLLSQAGYRVALNDLLPNRVEPIAAEINSSGGLARVDLVDPTRKLALQTMLHAILEAWGRIDTLIFIANVQPQDSLLDMDEWDWHRALDQNLTAGFLCTQSVGRIMQELGGGTIIYVLAGDETKQSPTYATAAAGLQALGAAAAQELKSHNIDVHLADIRKQTPAQIMELCERIK